MGKARSPQSVSIYRGTARACIWLERSVVGSAGEKLFRMSISGGCRVNPVGVSGQMKTNFNSVCHEALSLLLTQRNPCFSQTGLCLGYTIWPKWPFHSLIFINFKSLESSVTSLLKPRSPEGSYCKSLTC